MNFYQKFTSISKENKSLVCVGLDSHISKIPEHLKSRQYPLFDFNREIIDATHDLVCAYKPNIAFYEASDGLVGLLQLKKTIEYIKSNYSDIPVILDAKNADIGSTNEGYVTFTFDYLGADAVTLHPYLGKEALKPFLERKDKGLFILCRTSNPGAGEFQDLLISKSQSAEALAKEDRIRFYQYIAQQVAKEWNYNGNCGLVVGATYPTELNIVRHIVGNGFPLLIPGIGAQGGDVEKTVKAGIDKDGLHAIINSSRGIIYAGDGENFAQKARGETKKLRDIINKFRK